MYSHLSRRVKSLDFDRINLTFFMLIDSNTGSGRLKTAHQNSVYDRFRGVPPSFSLSGDLVRDLIKHQGEIGGHQIHRCIRSKRNTIASSNANSSTFSKKTKGYKIDFSFGMIIYMHTLWSHGLLFYVSINMKYDMQSLLYILRLIFHLKPKWLLRFVKCFSDPSIITFYDRGI